MQVGNFSNTGYDQIALYKVVSTVGEWKIYDARGGSPGTAVSTKSFGQTNDIPVAGKYLSGGYTDPAVWRPGTEQFIVEDTTLPSPYENKIFWGSNNKFGVVNYPYDKMLKIKTPGSTRHRPVAYRPTRGAFPYATAGTWWVHDLY